MARSLPGAATGAPTIGRLGLNPFAACGASLLGRKRLVPGAPLLAEPGPPPNGGSCARAGAFAVLGHEDVAKNLICVDDLIRLMLAVVRGGPEPGSVFHLVNPRTVSVRVPYSTMVERLGITCLRLAPSLPASRSEEEQALRHGIEVYEPYAFSQEPVFDTSRTRSLLADAAVDRTLPLDRERLRFLLGEHIRRRLVGSVNTPAPADGGPARARAAVAAR